LKHYGNSEPRLQTTPIVSQTKGNEVVEFAKQIEMPLLPWQENVILESSKIKEDGSFQHKTNLIIAARQNGKTHLLRMRILAGLFLWDEKLQVATAQNRDLSLETFRQVIEVVDSFDWLRRKVKHITRSNGREEIEIKNTGCRYKIIAPSEGAARGLSSDVVYLDEVRQHKTFGAFSALAYTMQARPNSQGFFISNAGDHQSVVLNNLRQRALDKIEKDTDDDINFMEWSAAPHRKLNDVEGWKEANPALGRTIDISAIKARMSDPTEVFMTECLSMWVTTMNSPWALGSWNSCMQPNLELKPDRPTWLGLEISPERTNWALTGTQVLNDGSIAVGLMECVESEYAIDDLVIAGRVSEWAKHYNAEAIVANRFSGDSVVAKLRQAGINAEVIKGSDYYQACDATLSAMSGGRLAHSNQPDLTASVNSCIKKANESGAWYIMRRQQSTAAISMVLAVFKAEQYGIRGANQDIVVG
jgi:hypothetical protein